MKISSQYSYQSFCSKNKSIRDADHIMRTAKKQFPIVSSTYIDTFYSDSTPKKNTLRTSVSQRFADIIEYVRDIYLSDHPAMFDRTIETDNLTDYNTALLQCLRKYKVGNCSENASLAVAALTGNGIDDAKKCYLYLKTYFISKENKIVLYKSSRDLDHSFAITSMGKNSEHPKDLIIVDPWLGFVDSASNAIARYKQCLCTPEKIEEIQKIEEVNFRKEMKKRNININNGDYEIKSNLSFFDYDITTKEQKRALERYIKEKFPEIIVDKE